MPAPFEIVNADGASDIVLLCEHASNFIPPEYHGLGLEPADLQRHIAWDIGAAQVARKLSALIEAPLILSGYSRLLIDCNRPLGTPTSIPEVSEATAIPGNIGISAAEREHRAQSYYRPFQEAVETHLDMRARAGRIAIVIGIHSFTPVFHGYKRPWHAGVLFRKSRDLGETLVRALQGPGLIIAANEPYTIEDDSDYTVPVHGEARGNDVALIEIRQDLIADDSGEAEWSRRLAEAFTQS